MYNQKKNPDFHQDCIALFVFLFVSNNHNTILSSDKEEIIRWCKIEIMVHFFLKFV
jgi:hypothetical protein